MIKRHRGLYRRVKAILARIQNVQCRLQNKPPACIPRRLRREFSMNGRSEILYGYADGSQSKPLVYDSRQIDAVCARIAARELGHYGGIDAWLYAALDRHPIKGQQVAIMGSADQGYGPWYECICLYYQGQPTTIDYNPIAFSDPRIRFVKAPVVHTHLAFDAAFSISSFEHDGLGRYGDPLDPNADLKAMRSMKQLIKKGGIMFLSVPLGKDKVVFNLHRIYGRVRLPLLLQGWTVADSFGFEDALLDRDTGFGWAPTVLVRGRNGTAETLLHPEYPEYGPVWVLRHD